MWVGMNRKGYSPMQGSKISKPEVYGEDEEGGYSRRVSRWRGLAFVPSPPPGSLEKITEQADSSRLELSLLIGYGGQADVGVAAGGSDDSSSSLSHRGTVTQHQQLSHITC